jgi:hypothetical protein
MWVRKQPCGLLAVLRNLGTPKSALGCELQWSMWIRRSCRRHRPHLKSFDALACSKGAGCLCTLHTASPDSERAGMEAIGLILAKMCLSSLSLSVCVSEKHRRGCVELIFPMYFYLPPTKSKFSSQPKISSWQKHHPSNCCNCCHKTLSTKVPSSRWIDEQDRIGLFLSRTEESIIGCQILNTNY